MKKLCFILLISIFILSLSGCKKDKYDLDNFGPDIDNISQEDYGSVPEETTDKVYDNPWGFDSLDDEESVNVNISINDLVEANEPSLLLNNYKSIKISDTYFQEYLSKNQNGYSYKIYNLFEDAETGEAYSTEYAIYDNHMYFRQGSDYYEYIPTPDVVPEILDSQKDFFNKLTTQYFISDKIYCIKESLEGDTYEICANSVNSDYKFIEYAINKMDYSLLYVKYYYERTEDNYWPSKTFYFEYSDEDVYPWFLTDGRNPDITRLTVADVDSGIEYEFKIIHPFRIVFIKEDNCSIYMDKECTIPFEMENSILHENTTLYSKVLSE